jgi:RNase H-fold protein (predicted Holliday junction resolvase)
MAVYVVRNTARRPNAKGPREGEVEEYLTRAHGELTVPVSITDEDVETMSAMGEVVERPADLETIPLRDKARA